MDLYIPRGLTARIAGFQPAGPGSTPGVGKITILWLKSAYTAYKKTCPSVMKSSFKDFIFLLKGKRFIGIQFSFMCDPNDNIV